MPSRRRRHRPSGASLAGAPQATLRDPSAEPVLEAGPGSAGERRPTSVLFGLTLAGLLAASVFAVYWQARNFDFVLLDDGVYVSDNPNVQQGLSLRNLKWSCQFQDGNWIPLTWLSLMLDADLSGPSPRGYHITNVLLHVANTLILFVLLTRATGGAIKSRNCRRLVRTTSAARGIGGVDCGAQGRSQHAFRAGILVGLRRIRDSQGPDGDVARLRHRRTPS